jgi:ABC-type branched-subunit amino acid transport system substrate-binding protein
VTRAARNPLLGLLVAVACSTMACTGGSAPYGVTAQGTPPPTSSGPVASRSASSLPGGRPITLGVAADSAQGSSDATYLEGMRLAADQINGSGGIGGRPVVLDLKAREEDPAATVEGLLRSKATAVLYVGPGTALTALRPRLEQTGTPVVLLGGDLYTSRGLFREVFQTTIPWVWQAHVIARYLVRDRHAKPVTFAGFGPEARIASAVMRGALEYWGGRLGASVIEPEGGSAGEVTAAVGSADAVVVFGSPEDSARVVRGLKELSSPPRIVGSASLLNLPPDELVAPAGTAACYTYTWAGWAQPIKRVAGFSAAFGRSEGQAWAGLAQEGYDAVRVLAAGLARTKGEGGSALVSALERVRQTFSSFPVHLGPDDHTFMPRDELGLFAVAGPSERLDPWQSPGSSPWRALMRAFTYDGSRTNVLPRDLRVFFPFWRRDLPAPNYWRSRYGIVTRAGTDAIH